MNPETIAIIKQAVYEVKRKYQYLEKQEFEQAKKEGREIGKREAIKRLKPILSDEELAEYTGISIERIKSIN